MLFGQLLLILSKVADLPKTLSFTSKAPISNPKHLCDMVCESLRVRNVRMTRRKDSQKILQWMFKHIDT